MDIYLSTWDDSRMRNMLYGIIKERIFLIR